jgi:glycosyl transferase, family 25
LGEQRSSRTDVHSLRWFDRLVLVKDVVASLRRVRNAVRWKRAQL